MVGLAGFEPATPSLSGTYSNQLSYRPINMVKTIKFNYRNKLIIKDEKKDPKRKHKYAFDR